MTTQLALVVGDLHIPQRAVDCPEDFKELLVPNKVQQVICTGNVGNRESINWLKGLSEKFTMVQGDYEHVHTITSALTSPSLPQSAPRSRRSSSGSSRSGSSTGTRYALSRLLMWLDHPIRRR